MVTAFISYRRKDNRHVTERVYDRLVSRFGRESIFKDVDAIPLGTDFRQVLERAVAKSDVQLVIIGQHWLTATDEFGRRRLDDEQDFVRVEIETALARRILVIPLLVDGADMPAAAELPAALREVAFRNGTVVRTDPDFHRDMDRLVRALETIDRLRAITCADVRPLVSELVRLHPADVVVRLIENQFGRERDPTRRQWLCAAAGLIDAPAAVRFLKDVVDVQSDHELVRRAAQSALRNISPHPDPRG
jgi:hypothetical protein